MRRQGMGRDIVCLVVFLTWVFPLLAADGPSLERIQTISLKGPAGRLDHMALDAKHSRLFVANMANASLDIVDLKTNKLVKQIPKQKGIQGIAYAPDVDRIFVGNGDGNACNVFDGKDYKLLKSIPQEDADNVRYQPSTGRIFVSHKEKGLAIIDAKTLEVRADIKLPADPESFQMEKDPPRLYVNTPSPAQVVVVDTEKEKVTRQYPLKLAGDNYPMALDEPGHHIIVGCRKKPMIVILDSESGKEVASIPIPADIDDLFLDSKRERIYASCGEGFLAVVNLADRKVVEKIPTVKLARTCLFDPDAGRLYLIVPRHADKEGPEIWVYQVKP